MYSNAKLIAKVYLLKKKLLKDDEPIVKFLAFRIISLDMNEENQEILGGCLTNWKNGEFF